MTQPLDGCIWLGKSLIGRAPRSDGSGRRIETHARCELHAEFKIFRAPVGVLALAGALMLYGLIAIITFERL